MKRMDWGGDGVHRGAMTPATQAPPRPPRRDQAAAAAARAAALAQHDPATARTLALEALAQAHADPDPAAASTAERALGLVAVATRDIDAALRHLRRAVRVAERHGLREPAATAREILAGTLIWGGDPAGALREIERAAPLLRGGQLGRLEMRRGLALYFQGRLDEALAAYRAALALLRRAGDHEYQAKLLNNRSMLHYQRGELKAAEADLRRAEELFAQLGQDTAVAEIW